MSLEGATFSATVTLTPSKMVFGGEWTIEGQISLKISGNIINKDSMAAAPVPAAQAVKVDSMNNQGHSVYYYVGVGVSAVGLGLLTVATWGADIPVLGGLAATTAAVVVK